MDKDKIEDGVIKVFGAKVHNLKDISLTLPRNKLVVFTGLSGSGKSSLAFDTILAEGQRRYMETFASYARQYIGDMKRPDVEKIEGLSPVVSIEQKTITRNPRSTVGTTTEIYDFLRLLYARIADAYSPITGSKMVRYTEEQLIQIIIERHINKLIVLLAPKVRARKGHYRELFEQYRKVGFTKIRVDGKTKEITPNMKVARYSIHDIELVIDRLTVSSKGFSRLKSSIQLALREGKGSLMVQDENDDKIYFYSRNLMCPDTGVSIDEPQPNTFSFNSPYGACSDCNGSGEVYKIDEETLMPDSNKSINEGGIVLFDVKKDLWTGAIIKAISKKYDFDLDTPIKKVPSEAKKEILYGSEDELNVVTALYNYEIKFKGLIDRLLEILENRDSLYLKDDIIEYVPIINCHSCDGARLKKEALNFKIDNKHIGEIANMQIDMFFDWISKLGSKLSGNKKTIANELLKEIIVRTQFILDVGLNYLSLNRPVFTLSGGEAQRIRLATQIGSQLINVLYIIDEPSIGLHQRDNHRLIDALKNLSDIGNSVVVVEHDKDMILSADYIVDLGPGAGMNGGDIVVCGNIDKVKKADSITADYLSGRKQIEIPAKRRKTNGNFLELKGASGYNLKNISVKFPLGNLICITGVSGSGKSSLVNETLYPIIRNFLYRSKSKALPYKKLEGIDNIDKIIEINQSPIGRTPRSNPATYTGIFTNIRSLFAELPEAKIRGYKPGRFSFNVKGGRCEECQGGGMKKIEMNFLPNVYIECPECRGKRYNRETLEVRYKGKSINDVLNLTINKAYDFFEKIPQLKRKLKILKEVGMGYVRLGQSSTTVSGGEAQRVKLATELSKRDTGKTLYILDEPTTGLHFEDIRILMIVLNKLVDRGNTVIVIEHNMEVIKIADHIIDLGPEGGDGGGKIVCQGTPEEIINNKKSYTARFLQKELNDHKKSIE